MVITGKPDEKGKDSCYVGRVPAAIGRTGLFDKTMARFRLCRSSHPIPVMPRRIRRWEMQKRPDEAGMEHEPGKVTKLEFGYKLHSLIDKEYPFVRRFGTSTASLHDNQVDLSHKGENVYLDKDISEPFLCLH